MTLEEEQALGMRIVAGDVAARDQLVIAHLELVQPIARRRQCLRVGACEDREAAGLLGLTEAATRFNPSLHPGSVFKHFARKWIRGMCSKQCYGCRHEWRRQLPDDVVDTRKERGCSDGELVEEIRARLRPRDAEIVVSHHGLEDGEPVQLKLIAACQGCTRQRVTRIYRRALGQLRVALGSE